MNEIPNPEVDVEWEIQRMEAALSFLPRESWTLVVSSCSLTFNCKFILREQDENGLIGVTAEYQSHTPACQLHCTFSRKDSLSYVAMATKALFKLGCDVSVIENQYDVHLTAHERLELREQMPREFWPQNWK